METTIKIENLKCGGCASSIKNGLLNFPEVKDVSIDKEAEEVFVKYDDGFPVDKIKEKLKSMGYPESGSVEGLDKFAANAKSYVSCAIGKLSKEKDDR